MNTEIQASNQLRKHIKFTWRNHVRSFLHRFRLGTLGKRVFIDSDVSLLRYPKNINLGDDIVLKKGAQICSCNESALIKIGNRTTVGFYTFIYASERIEIGADCLIAPFVYIVDSDHSIQRNLPINQQANQSQQIRIMDDVWIATGAKILKGVTIGQGAVVAAGAVVKEDVEPFSIVGGIPAKVLGHRN